MKIAGGGAAVLQGARERASRANSVVVGIRSTASVVCMSGLLLCHGLGESVMMGTERILGSKEKKK